MKLIYTQQQRDLPNIPARALDIKLDFKGPITAEQLTLLPEGLQTLHLNAIHDDALDHLARRFTDLRALRLQTAALTSLAPLANLKHLRDVTLDATGQALPDLAPLSHIQSLGLVHPQLDAHASAACIRAVAAMPALEALRLHGAMTRDPDALLPLQGSALRSLSLDAIDAAEIAALCAIPSLTRLSCVVRDTTSLTALKPLHDKLDRLLLSLLPEDGLNDAFLHIIAKELPHLRALHLGNLQRQKTAPYTAADLAGLSALKRLEWLNTGYLPDHIKAADLSWLTALPALQHIVVYGQGITAKIADILKGCTALRTISLRGAQLTDAAIKKLTGLQLEAFEMVNNRAFTDAGVVEIAKIKTLRKLSIPDVNDARLKALATLPALEELQAFFYGPLDSLKHLVTAKALWHIDVTGGNGELGLIAAAALKQLPELLHVNGVGAGAGRLAGHALATADHARVLTICPDLQTYI